MNQDNDKPTDRPPIQIIVEPTPKKAGFRIEWVIVGLVCLVAVFITIGGLIGLLAPELNEAFGYSLAIGVGLAAVASVVIAIVQTIKGKGDKR